MGCAVISAFSFLFPLGCAAVFGARLTSAVASSLAFIAVALALYASLSLFNASMLLN
jgi:hypothetical protein